MFISDRFASQLEDAGLKVKREGDYLDVSSPDDEDLDFVEDVCLRANFSDAVMFKQIVGPPALECSYTGFVGIEED